MEIYFLKPCSSYIMINWSLKVDILKLRFVYNYFKFIIIVIDNENLPKMSYLCFICISNSIELYIIIFV